MHKCTSAENKQGGWGVKCLKLYFCRLAKRKMLNASAPALERYTSRQVGAGAGTVSSQSLCIMILQFVLLLTCPVCESAQSDNRSWPAGSVQIQSQIMHIGNPSIPQIVVSRCIFVECYNFSQNLKLEQIYWIWQKRFTFIFAELCQIHWICATQ